MPKLNYPTPPWTISNGDTISAAEMQSLLYSGSAPSTSLAILNGYLDNENVGIDDIEAEHTQRGSAVRSDMVSSTLSLDYFDYLWGDHDPGAGSPPSWDSTDVQEATAIPGACRDFYMPWNGYAMIKFQVFLANNSTAVNSLSVAFLEVDGSYVTGQHRYVGRSINAVAAPPVHEGYKCSRLWVGHHRAALTAGHHSAAIKLIAHQDCQQTRAWARNMIVTRYKYVP